jgi:hypothetical protein
LEKPLVFVFLSTAIAAVQAAVALPKGRSLAQSARICEVQTTIPF